MMVYICVYVAFSFYGFITSFVTIQHNTIACKYYSILTSGHDLHMYLLPFLFMIYIPSSKTIQNNTIGRKY